MANRQTSSRRALPQGPSVPWEAQEGSPGPASELRIIPRAPAGNTGRRPAYVPAPPPVPDEGEEPIITGSFRAPEDLPLAGPARRSESSRRDVPIGEVLQETFAQRRYGPARYRVHIAAPEGTGAKRPGRQEIALVSHKEPGPALPCGWMNVAQREAQIRSYGVMVKRYKRRHSLVPKLSEEEYDRFIDKLMDTLFDEGFQIVHLVSDEEEGRPAGWLGRWLRLSVRPGLKVASLTVLAFALGVNAERLDPTLFQQTDTWLPRTLAWMEQTAAWMSQVPSSFPYLFP